MKLAKRGNGVAQTKPGKDLYFVLKREVPLLWERITLINPIVVLKHSLVLSSAYTSEGLHPSCVRHSNFVFGNSLEGA